MARRRLSKQQNKERRRTKVENNRKKHRGQTDWRIVIGSLAFVFVLVFGIFALIGTLQSRRATPVDKTVSNDAQNIV